MSPMLSSLLFLFVEIALVAALLLERSRFRRAQTLLERRLGNEAAISQSATRLSECATEEVEPEILKSLRVVLEVEGADRASWIVLDNSESGLRNAYSAHASGTSPTPEFYCRAELPWVTASLLRDESVMVSRLEDLPIESELDRRYMEDRHVRSVALIPSNPGGPLRGVLVLVYFTEERAWPEGLGNRLRVLGDIFASALMRKQAQERMKESEMRFSHLFEEAPIGIAIEDLDGRILFSNPALCSMLGFTLEEMRGMNCSQFEVTGGEEEEWRHLLEMKAGSITGYRKEKRYTRKDGSGIWGSLNVSLLRGPGAPLVLATVEDITEKRMATENLTQAHSDLQQLTLRLFTTQEEERLRIARELHDDVGQRLSLVSLDLEILKSEMEEQRLTDRLKINSVLRQLDDLATDVHNMSHQLHSSKLQHLGLSVAIKEVCEQVSRQHKVLVELFADELPRGMPENVSLCLYRVAQEALQNAIKHSRSKRIFVRLMKNGSRLILYIKDFGLGFKSTNTGHGLGLIAMQERLRMIGGRLHVDSSPEVGTQVTAEVDLESVSKPELLSSRLPDIAST